MELRSSTGFWELEVDETYIGEVGSGSSGPGNRCGVPNQSSDGVNGD